MSYNTHIYKISIPLHEHSKSTCYVDRKVYEDLRWCFAISKLMHQSMASANTEVGSRGDH